MSHLLRNTGPSKGSASHIFWRSLGRQEPNYIAMGLVEVSVVSLTDFVVASGASEELQIRRGFRLIWSRQARREIRSCRPKKRMASGTERMMLKPRLDRSRSSWRQKGVEVADVADMCGPLAIPAFMDAIVQRGPTSAGSPSEA